jgi:hypothetical protein
MEVEMHTTAAPDGSLSLNRRDKNVQMAEGKKCYSDLLIDKIKDSLPSRPHLNISGSLKPVKKKNGTSCHMRCLHNKGITATYVNEDLKVGSELKWEIEYKCQNCLDGLIAFSNPASRSLSNQPPAPSTSTSGSSSLAATNPRALSEVTIQFSGEIFDAFEQATRALTNSLSQSLMQCYESADPMGTLNEKLNDFASGLPHVFIEPFRSISALQGNEAFRPIAQASQTAIPRASHTADPESTSTPNAVPTETPSQRSYLDVVSEAAKRLHQQRSQQQNSNDVEGETRPPKRACRRGSGRRGGSGGRGGK